MTIVLNNAEIDSLIRVEDCIEPLRAAYLQLAEGEAINRARSDIYSKHERPPAYYVFKTMEGVLAQTGVVALRINSDVIEWNRYAGGIRKDKIPLADGRYVGLIILFSTSTGAPLAIIPDGVIQRLRVAASNAIAADYMADPAARVLAIIGSGWQAGSLLSAMCAVRDLTEVRVFSPNQGRRDQFVAENSAVGPSIRAVESVQEAVRGADIVGCATNSLQSVIAPGDLEPGMHLNSIRVPELGSEILDACKRVIVHGHQMGPINHLVGGKIERVVGNDPVEVDPQGHVRYADESPESPNARVEAGWSGHEPTLTDLVNGSVVGRQDEDEINAFVNNVGLGIQFAALGQLVVTRAQQAGIGRELPTEWFTEIEHP